jgi:hypothetical protein
MTPLPEGLLKVAHVGILFWVDLGIRKENRQVTIKSVSERHVRGYMKPALDVELHVG